MRLRLLFSLLLAFAPFLAILAQQSPGGEPVSVSMDSLYRWRIKQEKLDGVYIPKDLEDCFGVLDEAMDEPTRKAFLELPEAEVDARTHNTIGLWMSVRWQMPEGSRITAKLYQMGLPHFDYMISTILVSYHRLKHGIDLKVEDQIAFYRAHWEKKQEEKRRNARQAPGGG